MKGAGSSEGEASIEECLRRGSWRFRPAVERVVRKALTDDDELGEVLNPARI